MDKKTCSWVILSVVNLAAALEHKKYFPSQVQVPETIIDRITVNPR
jgi:hypothetical protein